MLKVFLLHGMGFHQPGKWADPVKELLKKKWLGHSLSQTKWEKSIEFVSIDYDKVFVEIVGGWSNRASAIAELTQSTDANLASTLSGWAQEADDTDQFVFSHATDVLLYYLMPLVRTRVQDLVAEEIYEHLLDNPSWGVIAHSLGTIVAHDTLHRLWLNQFQDRDFAAGRPAVGQARFVAMIANVSRLAQTDFDVYNSLVKPGEDDQPGRMCRHYLTIDHRFDPFTRLAPFDRTDWVEDSLWRAKRYQRILPRHFHQKNVHDLEHYFKHPAVHIPILRLLNSENKQTRPSWETHDDTVDAFPNFPGGVVSEEFEDKLDQLVPGSSEGTAGLQRLARAFQALM